MVRFFWVVIGAALLALLLGVAVFKVELPLLVTLGMGSVCLAWLGVILVLPWNLYFRARHLLAEMDRAGRRSVPVDEEARTESRRVASAMLRVSLGLHLASAALVALGSWLFGQSLGYAFAGLFLLSTLFRPAIEYHRYLQQKLSGFLKEVNYPRDDVLTLVDDVSRLVSSSESQRQAIATLQRELIEQGQVVQQGDLDNQRRLDAVARKFEETIDRLTDNQEIISGIKAFLRLVQPARPA